MRASGVKRLKEIEGKHPKLKRIYAHLAMENEALKERINRCYRREVFDAYFFGITRRSARDHSSLDDFLQRRASPSITRKPALSILPPTTDPDQKPTLLRQKLYFQISLWRGSIQEGQYRMWELA